MFIPAFSPAAAKTPVGYTDSGWKVTVGEVSEQTPFAMVWRLEKSGSKPVLCEVPVKDWPHQECRLLKFEVYCRTKGSPRGGSQNIQGLPGRVVTRTHPEGQAVKPLR